jgi:poly(3-hydroxybutyrate) depolymerase
MRILRNCPQLPGKICVRSLTSRAARESNSVLDWLTRLLPQMIGNNTRMIANLPPRKANSTPAINQDHLTSNLMRPSLLRSRSAELIMLLFTFSLAMTQGLVGKPLKQEIEFEGTSREYFVHLPDNFDPLKTYWLIVSVHGGGGNGRSHFLASGLWEAVRESSFDAIVVSPSFSNTDFQASRFPELGEGEFLKQVLKDIHTRYSLRKKILLAGYSRGGQFSHRFAFSNPELVKAVAPCSAGTWTTPDGKLLIEGVGTIEHPATYLANPDNAAAAPERLQGMFTERVAQVAGLAPHPDAHRVPFLVMCGSLDTRFEISQQFSQSLKDAGFHVETEWPRTPHGSREKEEFAAEFEKYPRSALKFFKEITNPNTK